MQQPGLDNRHRDKDGHDRPQARQHADPHAAGDLWSRFCSGLRPQRKTVRLPASSWTRSRCRSWCTTPAEIRRPRGRLSPEEEEANALARAECDVTGFVPRTASADVEGERVEAAEILATTALTRDHDGLYDLAGLVGMCARVSGLIGTVDLEGEACAVSGEARKRRIMGIKITQLGYHPSIRRRISRQAGASRRRRTSALTRRRHGALSICCGGLVPWCRIDARGERAAYLPHPVGGQLEFRPAKLTAPDFGVVGNSQRFPI